MMKIRAKLPALLVCICLTGLLYIYNLNSDVVSLTNHRVHLTFNTSLNECINTNELINIESNIADLSKTALKKGTVKGEYNKQRCA